MLSYRKATTASALQEIGGIPIFSHYARQDLERWQTLVRQQVTHKTRETSRITAVARGSSDHT